MYIDHKVSFCISIYQICKNIIDFISRDKQVQPNIVKTEWSVWSLLEKLGSPGYTCQHVNYVVIALVSK